MLLIYRNSSKTSLTARDFIKTGPTLWNSSILPFVLFYPTKDFVILLRLFLYIKLFVYYYIIIIFFPHEPMGLYSPILVHNTLYIIIIIIYIYIYIYIYYKIRIQAVLIFSCIYKQLDSYILKHKTINVTICIVLSLTVIYNMYISL